MTLDSYNGWSNRETWNANLWMTNEEFIYDHIREIATSCYSVSELADNMEAFLLNLWECSCGAHHNTYHTPDGDSLDPVNWVEIAEAWAEAHELFNYNVAVMEYSITDREG